MKLLTYNPEERYSAQQALAHPYFKDLVYAEILENKKSFSGSNIVRNGSSPVLIKSFLNETDSFIKSTDESLAVNVKDGSKNKNGCFTKENSFLPEIKLNSNFNSIEVDTEKTVTGNQIFISTKLNLMKNKSDVDQFHTDVK
jgi:serine/threonine protein kinase